MNNAIHKYNRRRIKTGLSSSVSYRAPEVYITTALQFLASKGKELTKVGNVLSYEKMCWLFGLPITVDTCINTRRTKLHNNYIVPINRVLATRGIRIATRNLITEFYIVATSSLDAERNRTASDSLGYRAMSIQAGTSQYGGVYQQFTARELDVLVAQYSAIYGL